jgi:cell division topological specificity factor
MLDCIQKAFGKGNARSKDIAKERLRLILVHDRVDVSPQFLEVIKDDIVKVISNYMEINEQEMELHLSNANSAVSLVVNIPINRMKRESLVTDED